MARNGPEVVASPRSIPELGEGLRLDHAPLFASARGRYSRAWFGQQYLQQNFEFKTREGGHGLERRTGTRASGSSTAYGV